MSAYIIIPHPPFSQNKNWILFGAIANEMLNPRNAIQLVDLKFFEKGHTFMSADSFHHSVERTIRELKDRGVYNFEDFKQVIKT